VSRRTAIGTAVCRPVSGSLRRWADSCDGRQRRLHWRTAGVEPATVVGVVPSAGSCDIAESCDGANPACAADGTSCQSSSVVPRQRRRVRRRRELHGLERVCARRRVTLRDPGMSSRRRLSAMWRNNAPARVRLVRRTAWRQPHAGMPSECRWGVDVAENCRRQQHRLPGAIPSRRRRKSAGPMPASAIAPGELHRERRCVPKRRLRAVDDRVCGRRPGTATSSRRELHRVGRQLPRRRGQASTEECRADAGNCDVAENCDGSASSVPPTPPSPTARRAAMPTRAPSTTSASPGRARATRCCAATVSLQGGCGRTMRRWWHQLGVTAARRPARSSLVSGVAWVRCPVAANPSSRARRRCSSPARRLTPRIG